MACHGYGTGQFFEGEMRRDEKGRHRSRDGQDKIVSWSFTVKFALSQLLCRKDVGTCHSRQVIMHKVNHFLLFYSFSVLKLRMGNGEVVVLSCPLLRCVEITRQNCLHLETTKRPLVSGKVGEAIQLCLML